MRLHMFGFGFTAAAVARLITPASITNRNSRANETEAGIYEATHLLVTAPPGKHGDPCLAQFAGVIAAARKLRWIGYCSTTGVYGDRDGALVTEQSEPTPMQERSRSRLVAENAWRSIRPDLPLDLFRLAGIYGLGRSAFDDLRTGRAKRILAPDQKFSRIHVDDAARAIRQAAEFSVSGQRVLHLADDEPAPSAEVIEFAANLLGVEPPPQTTLAEAMPAMSPMAQSFWSESRRISNAETRTLLALEWIYPSFREGLQAILAEERREQG